MLRPVGTRREDSSVGREVSFSREKRTVDECLFVESLLSYSLTRRTGKSLVTSEVRQVQLSDWSVNEVAIQTGACMTRAESRVNEVESVVLRIGRYQCAVWDKAALRQLRRRKSERVDGNAKIGPFGNNSIDRPYIACDSRNLVIVMSLDWIHEAYRLC